MDVHRCRFVPYQPSAINAVAFSHPKARTAKHSSVGRLAIGRANGDIEIWNPSNGSWHQELVIRGGKDRSIDGLVWINEPDQDLGDGRVMIGKSRLFSIGYTSTITEWDLEKGKPKRHASGQHGDIWCLAAQPAGPADGPAPEAQNSNKLIAGTIDGELVMYSVEDDDLRLQRVLVKSPTKKSQMVSITFQSRKVVIVGCSDSTIRAYDITKGHMLRRNDSRLRLGWRRQGHHCLVGQVSSQWQHCVGRLHRPNLHLGRKDVHPSAKNPKPQAGCSQSCHQRRRFGHPKWWHGPTDHSLQAEYRCRAAMGQGLGTPLPRS